MPEKGIEVNMKKQKYIIESPNSFELKDIFDCGQCFRWNKENDDSYTGIWKNNVVNVKKENDTIILQELVVLKILKKK